jgi:FixJ family two-component response regulator
MESDISNSDALVLVVDHDAVTWARLKTRLERLGVRMEFSDRMPEALLWGHPKGDVCLIIDVKPGGDCFQFQRRLVMSSVCVPIIFVSDCGNISMSVEAIKNGAVDFLGKPCRDDDLLTSIEEGLARDRVWTAEHRALSALEARYDTLSQRERQVMRGVENGRMNKQIAYDLGISEITVKAHRGQVMRKMKATCLPELARMADRIEQKSQSYEDMAFGKMPQIGSRVLLSLPSTSLVLS